LSLLVICFCPPEKEGGKRFWRKIFIDGQKFLLFLEVVVLFFVGMTLFQKLHFLWFPGIVIGAKEEFL